MIAAFIGVAALVVAFASSRRLARRLERDRYWAKWNKR